MRISLTIARLVVLIAERARRLKGERTRGDLAGLADEAGATVELAKAKA